MRPTAIKEYKELALEAIVWTLLNEIEMLVNMSMTEDRLRDLMKAYTNNHLAFEKHLIYGFGHNHMWVSEVATKRRLILVEF